MQQRTEEVFDWAQHWPEEHHAELLPYQPPTAPVVLPPVPRVVQPTFGTPYYAHVPQPLPAYDPIPARRQSLALLVMAYGVSGTLLELGSWVFFKGVAMADHGLISLGIAAGTVAACIFAAKSGGSSVRISNFHQGDNAHFSAGGQR